MIEVANTALELAVRASINGEEPRETVERARQFYKFLTDPLLAQSRERLARTLMTASEVQAAG